MIAVVAPHFRRPGEVAAAGGGGRPAPARVKAPYPATHDPAYDVAIRAQAADLLATPNVPAWTYLDPARLSERLARPETDRATRAGIDFALYLDRWLTR